MVVEKNGKVFRMKNEEDTELYGQKEMFGLWGASDTNYLRERCV